MKKIGFLFLICLSWAYADDKGSYKQGKDLAASIAPQGVTLDGINQLEGFVGTNVLEKRFIDSPASLTNEAQKSLQGETGQFLIETQDKRPLFKKLDTDSYFTEADRVVADPLKILKAKEKSVSPEVTITHTKHTCFEGGDPILHVCRKRRHIYVKELKPKLFYIRVNFYNHGQRNSLGINILTGAWLDGVRSVAGGGHSTGRHIIHGMPTDLHDRIIKEVPYTLEGNVSLNGNDLWSSGHIWFNNFAQIGVTYLPRLTEADLKEEEEDGCTALEKRADQGQCVYEDLDILDGEGTKTFGTEATGKVTIYREWWDKKYTYACHSSKKDTCHAFRAKGCEQIGSECNKEKAGRCIRYQQTFKCQTKSIGKNTVTMAGKVPYCLTGNCDTYQWAPNKDMAEAISRLAIFKEIQKDMDPHSLSVFKGSDKRCRKNCLSFRDCCGQGQGWGKSVGYSCSADEQALSLLRDEQKCVLVGTYCAEKVLGQCITKKTSFCCFGTKLSKLIHEQGRNQLGISWGSPKEPNCRGFTITELSHIDFSKLDLSSLYTEIRANIKPPNIAKMSQEIKESLRQRAPHVSSFKQGTPYKEESCKGKKRNIHVEKGGHENFNQGIPQDKGQRHVF